MFETMRRLHPRGAASRGVCVDAEGAMLGPDWPLVERISSGYRVAPRTASRDIQKILLDDQAEPDWLYKQGQRIADALSRGEVALAQIYGLRIPIGDIDRRQLTQLASLATLHKAGFNPDEPRIPAGEPGAGEWTTGGGTAANEADTAAPDAETAAPPASGLRNLEVTAPSPSPLVVGSRFPAPIGPNPLLHPAQMEEDENGRRGGLLGDFMNLPREFRRENYEALRARLREIDPGNPALDSLTGPNYSPTQRDIDNLSEALRQAQERAGEPPATQWELGWGVRGIQLELERLGGQRTLPTNAPTIDDFSYDVALSIKSIDLNAPWYRNSSNLSRQIDSYVDKLVAFTGMRWGGNTITEDQINGRVLDIVVPKNSGTLAQRQAITISIKRARRLGIQVFISPY